MNIKYIICVRNTICPIIDIDIKPACCGCIAFIEYYVNGNGDMIIGYIGIVVRLKIPKLPRGL